jgi:metal-dependent amidase/aminoacylase/carboxypeptidase family protein
MKAIIADGVMDGPRSISRLHSTTIRRCRRASVSCTARASRRPDRFDIVVRANRPRRYPHTTVDPLVAAAMLVAQLQTVVPREVRPMHPAVVTMGAIQGGTTYNIIPDTCLIKGTVRTLHAEARDMPAASRPAAACLKACASPEVDIAAACPRCATTIGC